MSKIAEVLKQLKEITPLWIIAIFLLLSETIVTLGVAVTRDKIQLILTIFACIFPILIFAMFFLILWFKPYVFYAPKEYRNGVDAKNYIDALRGNIACLTSARSESPRYVALFLIKTKIKNANAECDKILTYLSPVWESYFIVNRRYDSDVIIEFQLEDLKRKLSEVIGVDFNDLSLDYERNCDFNNVKYSFSEKKDALYLYKIFYVTITNVTNYPYLINETFDYGGRHFRWMTIAEMKMDTQKTYERNSDIIRFLTDYFHELYLIPPSF
jgi:hypothetical protein